MRTLFALALPLLLACGAAEPAAPVAPARGDAPPTAWVEIGGELFELELAADPRARHRGLSGRRGVERSGGMLFVFPDTRPLAMVMRDCPVDLDVAFLDESGRVINVHAMRVEPPRKRLEPAFAYESRLPVYASERPGRFAVETAGGRLAELGVKAGQTFVFDAAGLLARAR